MNTQQQTVLSEVKRYEKVSDTKFREIKDSSVAEELDILDLKRQREEALAGIERAKKVRAEYDAQFDADIQHGVDELARIDALIASASTVGVIEPAPEPQPVPIEVMPVDPIVTP